MPSAAADQHFTHWENKQEYADIPANFLAAEHSYSTSNEPSGIRRLSEFAPFFQREAATQVKRAFIRTWQSRTSETRRQARAQAASKNWLGACPNCFLNMVVKALGLS